jgi:hypothetical protein
MNFVKVRTYAFLITFGLLMFSAWKILPWQNWGLYPRPKGVLSWLIAAMIFFMIGLVGEILGRLFKLDLPKPKISLIQEVYYLLGYIGITLIVNGLLGFFRLTDTTIESMANMILGVFLGATMSILPSILIAEGLKRYKKHSS